MLLSATYVSANVRKHPWCCVSRRFFSIPVCVVYVSVYLPDSENLTRDLSRGNGHEDGKTYEPICADGAEEDLLPYGR